ncbi:MAG TPA: SRPBCC family protein [Actinomycetes bacterium]|nr:SRPBCC family protein [Actinomycetes bacterium]
MSTHSSSIEVDRPVRTVYNQWTQFESFPAFMEGVQSVQQIDDKSMHWTVDIAGVEREFDAVITRQDPDAYIAWESTNGPRQAGQVSFEPLGTSATKVTLGLDFDPEGFKEHAGDALGFVGHRISGDLDRFKSFVEENGSTGAWRGTV